MQQLKIYNYDPSTLDFSGEAFADESPMEDGVYLLPAAATDIPPPQFDALVQRCLYVNGLWQVSSIPGPSLVEIKSRKLAEIDASAASAIAPITSAYSQAERDTWPIQEAEAASWLVNPASATPILTAIAAQRAMAMADLVASVQTKAAAFKVLAGAVFGKRRALVDRVAAATSPETVAVIVWD